MPLRTASTNVVRYRSSPRVNKVTLVGNHKALFITSWNLNFQSTSNCWIAVVAARKLLSRVESISSRLVMSAYSPLQQDFTL